MIRQLFYVSIASDALTKEDVNEVLTASRRNNQRRDITGCLLYAGGVFAQVLEGEAKAVAEVAERIVADPRHHGIRIVVDRTIVARSYANWSMGFVHRLDLEDGVHALLKDAAPVDPDAMIARIRPDTVLGALA